MDHTDNSIRTIRAIVAEILALSPDEIDDTEDFVGRYQADSLNLIEIVAQVEKQYHVVLPQRELPAAHSVTTLFELVARHAD